MNDTDPCRSCIDCAAAACNGKGGAYPSFCLTTGMDPAVMDEAMAAYRDETNNRITRVAAEIETDGYCRWCRVRETMEFAHRMGFHRIGIASCVGLLSESRTLAKILRANGFEVFGIGCKAGAVPKTEVGIPARCQEVGKNMCNPILQAKLLNREKTELNVVMGLCVGHDSLFYKYSEGIVTTLVTKDRVTGHNPVAALYTSGSYYKKLFDVDFDERP